MIIYITLKTKQFFYNVHWSFNTKTFSENVQKVSKDIQDIIKKWANKSWTPSNDTYFQADLTLLSKHVHDIYTNDITS